MGSEDGWTILPCGHEVLVAGQPHYCTYIGWNGIEPFAHSAHPGMMNARPFHNPDEGLFISVHQQSELSFARVIADLEYTRTLIDQGDYALAARHVRLAAKWLELSLQSTKMLFAMDTALFMKPGVGFRDLVVPASGAESIAAREIEILAGMRENSPYMQIHGRVFTFRQTMDIPPGVHGRHSRWWTHQMARRAGERSVAEAFDDALAREGHVITGVLSLKITHPLRSLFNALWQFEKGYLNFRKIHFQLARHHFKTANKKGYISVAPDELKGTGATGAPSPAEEIPSALKYLEAIFRTARLFPKIFEIMEGRDPTMKGLRKLHD